MKHVPHLTPDEIDTLAGRFASHVPEGSFSLAQIQGYMLTKKSDPYGAVEGVAQWVEDQLAERRKLEELKAKKKQKMKEKAEAARKRAAEYAAAEKKKAKEEKKDGDDSDSDDDDEKSEAEDEKTGAAEDDSRDVAGDLLEKAVIIEAKDSEATTDTFESAVDGDIDEPAVAL